MSETNDLKFEKNIDFPWQTIELETIIIDPKTKSSFELNEVGSIIWNQIDGKRSINEIAHIISNEFGESEERVQVDLKLFTQQLFENNLIKVVE